MTCREFRIELEDYFALRDCRSAARATEALPTALAGHASQCPSCGSRLEAALQCRRILGTLLEETAEPAPMDPYFYSRLRSRIDAEIVARRHPIHAMAVAWTDLAAALLLFAACLSGFVYGISRTEWPGADAAIAVQVPRSNPYRNASSASGQAKAVDEMVSFITP